MRAALLSLLLRPKQKRVSGASLLAGLIGYWRLDEASGTRNDSTANGLHLTDVNTVGSAAGKIGNAADFVAANSETLDSPIFTRPAPTATAWSFSAWFNRPSIATRNGVLTGLLGTDVVSVEFNTSQLNVIFIAGFVGYAAISSAISAATWLHLVIVYDGSQADNASRLRVYLDGVLTPVTSFTGTVPASFSLGTDPFSLGKCVDSGVFHDGLIDEAGFWARALSQDDVSLLYNAGAGRVPSFA